MFPLLQVSLSGLDSSASYALLLEFKVTEPHRLRFLNGEWQAAANSVYDVPEHRTVYIHPSSPLTGNQWMKEKVTFSKLKLSNKEDGRGKVRSIRCLYSSLNNYCHDVTTIVIMCLSIYMYCNYFILCACLQTVAIVY